MNELAAILDRLTLVLERLEQRLDPQLQETGDKTDAAKLLKVSTKTIERRMKDMPKQWANWQDKIHYWHEGGKIVFDLELLRDWQRNRRNPAAHQRAIEVRRKQLPSQKKR